MRETGKTSAFFARVVCIGTICLLSACTGTKLPGKLYSLSDGNTMNFQIETSYGTGSMFAQDELTGESFSGQYTSTYKGGGAVTAVGGGRQTGTITSPGNMYRYSGNTASTTTYFAPPTGATARGVLMGDKGTVIELYMEIRPGIIPKGHGTGIDNRGMRYQVQF